MAKHEFGIMERAPLPGERYDRYEPEKYGCISLDDEDIERILHRLLDADCFWHTLDDPGKGLAYAGITLIPPGSMGQIIDVMEGSERLEPLRTLLRRAQERGKFVIHFGI